MPAKTKTVKGKKPATATKKSTSAKTQADTCEATTTRGTPCSLKPQPGSAFCARHADIAAPATDGAAKKDSAAKVTKTVKKATKKATKTAGKKDNEGVEKPATPAKKTTKRATKKAGKDDAAAAVVATDQVDPPLTSAEEEVEKVRTQGLKAERDTQSGRPKRFKPKAPGQRTLPTTPPPAEPVDEKEEEKDDGESNGDPDFVDYASSYSGMIEASPYDDQITTEMAIGVDDIDDGDDTPRQERPTMTEDEARQKAIETIGPAPDIIPEEDVDDRLGDYERRIQAEMRRLMGGGGRRRRGRRGGRGRRSGTGDGGGPRDDRPRGQGQGQGRRRGGRGRRGGGRREGGRRDGERRGPGGGGGGSPNVSRDSPLANNRPSRGPKRGFQPRKRREPDV